jgi:ABC-type transport system involved in multi-copper enzyme maturation permease subunit
MRTELVIARLTLVEIVRRKVVWALGVLTVLLLGLTAWGFAKIPGLETGSGPLTSGEANLAASQLLNLVMFTLSLIVALGTAMLAGPTVAGELESGVALSVVARPVRRSSVLIGKWLGLVIFAMVYVLVAGGAEIIIVRATVGYEAPGPVPALAQLVAEAVILLTLALFFSTLISPLAAGILTVGLFGAVWVAGVVGGVGEAFDNDGVARVGSVSRVLLPTDGLWHGAMHSLQGDTLISRFGAEVVGSPFVGAQPLSAGYLLWSLAWVAGFLAAAAVVFNQRDV